MRHHEFPGSNLEFDTGDVTFYWGENCVLDSELFVI